MARVYSHSQLGAFENCPKQYWFHYLSGDRMSLDTIESFLGNRYHEVMERLYENVKLGRTVELPTLLAYFDEIWEKEWHDEVLIVKKDRTIDDYRRAGHAAIEGYFKRYSPFRQDTTLEIEGRVSFSLDAEDKYQIKGFIDRLAKRPDGVWEIHDYKTSEHLPAQEYLDRDRQLALYEIGVRHKFPKQFDRVELVWHYVRYGEEFRSTRTKEQLEAISATTRSLIDTIEAEKVFPTNESALCNYCAYRSVCPLFRHEYLVETKAPLESGAGLTHEESVSLVDQCAQRDEAIKLLTQEKEGLKEMILAYAKAHGLSRLVGSQKQVGITETSGFEFPSTSEEDAAQRQALENAIRAAGLWDQLSALNTRAFDGLLKDPATPEIVRRVLQPFAKSRDSVTARISKRKVEKEK